MRQVMPPAEPQRPGPPPPAFVRGATAFVWGVWALMLLAALFFVGNYGSNVPFFDELEMVAILTGQTSVTADWLWSQHGEHRIPLPKLLLLALYQLSGDDFRAGMVFNVVALAALAFVLIRTAQRVRGWLSYTDALFPVALLQWGHAENLLWSWQVSFVLPTVIAGLMLAVIIRNGTRLTPRAAALAGTFLLMLPLCGANALLLVPALTLWLGAAGVLRWVAGGPGGRGVGVVSLAFALAAALLAGLYFIGYHGMRAGLSTPHLRTIVGGALQFLTGGLGPATTQFWPYLAVGVGGFLLLSAGLVVRSVWQGPMPERTRALGLLCFLAAFGCLGLGVGVGRPGANFVNLRYMTLAVPALCGAYFLWVLYGPAAVRPWVQTGLVGLLGIMVALGLPGNLRFARHRRAPLEEFERDLRDGAPPSLLIKRYGPALFPLSSEYEPARCQFPATQTAHEYLTASLEALHRAGIGPFQFLHDEPSYEEVPLAILPTELHHMMWEGETGTTTGKDPYLLFSLPVARRVCGVRVEFSYVTREGGEEGIRLCWKRADQATFAGATEYFSNEGDWGPFWVQETIDQIRIHPTSHPSVLQLSAIVLLVPASEEMAAAGERRSRSYPPRIGSLRDAASSPSR